MAAATKGEKIVVIAVDHSLHSDSALEYYLTYLHKSSHEVYLVHAAEVPKMARPYRGVNIEDAETTHTMWLEATERREAELKDLRGHLERIVAGSGRKVDYKIFITQYHHGHLGEAICDEAEDKRATMIVVGSRGLGTFRRTILGSVSDYVLHHAKCPVIICHFEHDRFHHQNEGRRSFSN